MEAGEPDSGEDAPSLSATQLQRWFEYLRGDVTGIYMSHPETLARLGYSGIADGANSAALSGFVQLGLGKLEAWEPKAMNFSLVRTGNVARTQVQMDLYGEVICASARLYKGKWRLDRETAKTLITFGNYV